MQKVPWLQLNLNALSYNAMPYNRALIILLFGPPGCGKGTQGRLIIDGHAADAIVVVARTSGAERDRDGLTLLLVPARSPGLTATRTLAGMTTVYTISGGFVPTPDVSIPDASAAATCPTTGTVSGSCCFLPPVAASDAGPAREKW